MTDRDSDNILASWTADMIVAASWIVAWQQLFYAGSLPGDGFTGGILLSIALLLRVVVRGGSSRSQRPAWPFTAALGLGLGLLLVLLAVPAVAHAPLTAGKIMVGSTVLSTTTVFEIAIGLVIVGSLMVLIDDLGKRS